MMRVGVMQLYALDDISESGGDNDVENLQLVWMLYLF